MSKEKNEILRIAEVMQQKNISRSELSKRIGKTTSTITNITTHYSYPTMTVLKDIAEAMDVDIRELLIPTKPNEKDRKIEELERKLDECIKLIKDIR